MALNHVHLKAKNLETTQTFYETYFGFRLIERNPKELYLVDAEGSWLTLSPMDHSNETLPDWFHFGFCYDSVEKVTALYESLKKGNASFSRELTRLGDDGVTFYVLDPSGNKIEVSWIRIRSLHLHNSCSANSSSTHNMARIEHRELRSNRTGEVFSLSAFLTNTLGFKDIFVHHEMIQPGRRSSSKHSHSHREEMLLVLKGQVIAYTDTRSQLLRSGDYIGFPPGEPHVVVNEDSNAAEILVVASNPAQEQVAYVD